MSLGREDPLGDFYKKQESQLEAENSRDTLLKYCLLTVAGLVSTVFITGAFGRELPYSTEISLGLATLTLFCGVRAWRAGGQHKDIQT